MMVGSCPLFLFPVRREDSSESDLLELEGEEGILLE